MSNEVLYHMPKIRHAGTRTNEPDHKAVKAAVNLFALTRHVANFLSQT